MNRDRHATVAQLRAAISELRDDDVLCVVNEVTGNIDVLRDDVVIGRIEIAAQDLSHVLEPSAELDLD